MNMTIVLREVEAWPPEQRLRLLEEVWSGLINEGLEPELTEAHKQELDRRIAAIEANPDDVITWEDVQRHLRRPR